MSLELEFRQHKEKAIEFILSNSNYPLEYLLKIHWEHFYRIYYATIEREQKQRKDGRGEDAANS